MKMMLVKNLAHQVLEMYTQCRILFNCNVGVISIGSSFYEDVQVLAS